MISAHDPVPIAESHGRPFPNDEPTHNRRRDPATLDRLEHRLSEAFDELYDTCVDPREALADDDGGLWHRFGAAYDAATPYAGFSTEPQLAEIRASCRGLAATNEFAINGHENRISYIVGSGHSYRATPKKGATPPADLTGMVQRVLDEFVRRNRWRWRQEEIVRRRDRDGEVFLRFFTDDDGLLEVRFVEPGQVATPTELAGDPSATFGIHSDRRDVETVLAYYIDGHAVSAGEIQHRKANVDANVKRGLPLFFPVRKNLRRAEKLLRNMSVLAEIQSAIALIRRHRGATASGVEQFVAAQADVQLAHPTTGKTSSFKRYAPGTILDAHSGVEYDFPTAGLDASSFVQVLKAELRAIASRLVMPEFMLTSDASNANYASTLVAEGPAVKMFARLQAQQIEDDLEVLWRAVDAAIDAGHLPLDAKSLVEIQVAAPSLTVRDELKEVQALRIEYDSGILSPQTWSQRRGLDYDQQQTNIAHHRALSQRDATGANS